VLSSLSRWVLLALVGIFFIGGTAELRAERRVALVVGNGAYKFVPGLPNPPSDATAIAGVLRNVGFDVAVGTDLSREQMADKLREFATTAQGADVALFFYAGHGISVDGKNYLIPIDVNLRSELDVKINGPIDVEVMLQQTMSDARIKLVFLDACRDNPFVTQITRAMPKSRNVAVSSGLTEMKSSEGTLLAFATGPGQVALDGENGNSPFTKALLNNLAAPDLEIRHMLTKVRAEVSEETRKQQLPWENTNLTGLFYMNKVSDAVVASATPDVPPAGGQPAFNEVEVEFWRSVKDSNKSEELNAYLTRYPTGAFASIARARVAALSSPATTPDSTTNPPRQETPPTAIRTADASLSTEDALGLDKAARQTVQRRLTALGFATRSADGKFGTGTRRALTAWQTARDYPASGFLNKLQHEALLAETPQPGAKPPVVAARTVAADPRRRVRQGPPRQAGFNPGGGAGAAGAFFGGVMQGVICGGRRRC